MQGSTGGFTAKKYKKATPIKKTTKEFVKKPELTTRKSLHEPGTSRKPVQESSPAAPAPAETSKLISGPVSVPTKATKLAKASVSPAYKAKTTKKTPQISTFLYWRITFIYYAFFIFYLIRQSNNLIHNLGYESRLEFCTVLSYNF